MFKPSWTGNYYDVHAVLLHEPLTTSSNEEIFIHGFLVILELKASELRENLEEMLVVSLAVSYLQSHLPITKVFLPLPSF